MRASAYAILVAALSHPLYAQPIPKFEVTDVHRSARISNPYTFMSGGVLRGTRYDLRKATLLDLIERVYDFPSEEILGGPNWMEFDRFDIAGKAPASSSPATITLMLQSLLADRFGLVVHKDSKPVPAFAILAGKDKPKMTPAVSEEPAQCVYIQQPNGSTITEYRCRNTTMQAFAPQLRDIAGDYLTQPVVDSTGIEGSWDFDLRWNRRAQALGAGSERTTIFDAVRKQLGLNLELRTAPAPVLVIDRVNDKPTANAPDVAQLLPPVSLQFEVATVKISPPDEQECCFQVTARGDLEANAIPLQVLLGASWDLDWDHTDEAILGLPGWVRSARFDIRGKAAVATNGLPPSHSGYIEDDVRLMLRALLIERFHIKFHYEDRPVNGYVLVNSKSKTEESVFHAAR